MTRENIFENAVREEWMTADLENSLLDLASDGKVPCSKAQQFARENSIPLQKMRALMDVLHLKVSKCQLGCF